MRFRVWDILNKKMLDWEEIKYLPASQIFSEQSKQKSRIVMRGVGRRDISGKDVYEGDIIENPGGARMEIKFGTYWAYCPVDKCNVDSVGFYAESRGCPKMPVGPLEDYAEVVGNIYENPELSESGKLFFYP